MKNKFHILTGLCAVFISGSTAGLGQRKKVDLSQRAAIYFTAQTPEKLIW